jgi:hypothetical protein
MEAQVGVISIVFSFNFIVFIVVLIGMMILF